MTNDPVLRGVAPERPLGRYEEKLALQNRHDGYARFRGGFMPMFETGMRLLTTDDGGVTRYCTVNRFDVESGEMVVIMERG